MKLDGSKHSFKTNISSLNAASMFWRQTSEILNLLNHYPCKEIQGKKTMVENPHNLLQASKYNKQWRLKILKAHRHLAIQFKSSKLLQYCARLTLKLGIATIQIPKQTNRGTKHIPTVPANA